MPEETEVSDYPALSQCHCVKCRRAASHLTECYTKMLKPCGLTLSQFSLLRNLSAMESGSTADLARRVRLDHSTLVRNLQAMQAQGLIRDEREAGRRLSVWRLTDRGRTALQTGTPLWQKAQKAVEDALGEENLTLLKDMMVRLQGLEEEFE